jgi:DNA-binding NarL/FixJ family response regulator
MNHHPLRIVLADDHRLVAEGICRVLEDSFCLIEAVTDGRSLVAAVARLRPDIVVTDITMPGLNGLDAIRTIRAYEDPPAVVVLTMHADPLLVNEAFQAGAGAYVIKHAAGRELEHAVLEVSEGRRYISPMLESLGPSHAAVAAHSHLTARQRQVLELTARGYRMKQVAAALHISRRTVESHKYQIMEVLNAHSTADLVQHAIRLGLISLGDVGGRRSAPFQPGAAA